MSKHPYNIILDLDQTLISAQATEEFDFIKNKQKSELFRHDDMDGYYVVYSRPHLQEFLDYIFKNFNVSIWTAATKDYALFIIDNIILNKQSERHIDFIFFSYHCDISMYEKQHSKDLSILWDLYKLTGYSKHNTVIIDDFVEDVHKCQPNNCIIAPPFEFLSDRSQEDIFLKELIPHLEQMKKGMIRGQLRGNDSGNTELAEKVNKNMKTK